MSANGQANAGAKRSADAPESPDIVEYRGYRIVLSHLVQDDAERAPFLIRVLAAMSIWGMQDDLWDWRVYRGDSLFASDQELSRLAALEGARHWVRGFAPEVDGDGGPARGERYPDDSA